MDCFLYDRDLHHERIFFFSPNINPLMHNLPKWSDILLKLTAFLARFLKCVWPFCDIMHKLSSKALQHLMCCVIWYRLYSFKNVQSTHGGVLFLVGSFTKSNTLSWVPCRFLKLYKLYQIAQSIS